MKKDKFPYAYQTISSRQNGLNFQSNQLITYMSKNLVESIKECMSKENAYVISIIIILALESESPAIEAFLMNYQMTFFDIIVAMYECNKEQCISMQKKILFSRTASTTIVPLLFPIFSQYPLEDLMKEPFIILNFMKNIFLIDPVALDKPNKQSKASTKQAAKQTQTKPLARSLSSGSLPISAQNPTISHSNIRPSSEIVSKSRISPSKIISAW